jgi:CheY-like chemotaxis protein
MSTILCIDDEPSILTLHKLLFETYGYNVITAAMGRIASARWNLDLSLLCFSTTRCQK